MLQIDGGIPGHTTVQKGDGIPHGAVSQPGQEQGGLGGKTQIFSPGDGEQTVADGGGGNPAEIIPLAPGQDGGRHLVDLGGGQDKQGMFRRLLQGFQQGVESAR